MAIKTVNLAKLCVRIVVMIQIFLFGAGFSEGDKFCSCYTYVNNSFMEWSKAAKSCQFNDKHLVVMETVREWEYIKKEIQTRKSGPNDEWLIGLYRNLSIGKWTWVNGEPLSFDKWQNEKPKKGDFYALIAKEFPKGFKGSFNSIKGNVYRGWICEEETDNCGGDCFSHIPIATNSTPPVTTTLSTQEQRTISTAYSSTTASVSTLTSSAPDVNGRKGDNDNFSTIVIVSASLASVLFVVLVVLVVVLLLRRRKRHALGKDEENPPKKSRHQPAQIGQNQYEPVDCVEVAKLLGTPDKAEKKVEHVPLTANCEYAVVNKRDKKRKEGDLVYAQLAEFDNENNAKTSKKPPSYEPTVYADVDVVPPEMLNPSSVDSTQPTYANVQTTGV